MNYLQRQGDNCLADDVINDFQYSRELIGTETLLGNDNLIDDALKLLSNMGGVEIDSDQYGPPIITLKKSIEDQDYSLLTESELATVTRYLKAGSRKRGWLDAALRNLLEDTKQDDSEEEAVEQVDEADDDSWQPLQLDRQDEKLSTVIKDIDFLAEQVRGDNGYGAKFAEEKRFVLDKLQAFSKILKEETSISWMYIREFAIKPIGILANRFGKAAIGVAAEAAKAAIKEWLKKKGLTFLDS